MFMRQVNGLGFVLALELPRGTGPDPSVLGRTTAARQDNVSRGMFLFESGSLSVAELGSRSSILSSLQYS